jgi:hypothetical protein
MKKLSRLLRSNKGVSSLVASLVLLITASMGTYLFKTVTDLSRPTQERITHLGNAMTMARAIDEHLRGSYLDEDRFAAPSEDGTKIETTKESKNISQVLTQRGVFIARATTNGNYYINTLDDLVRDSAVMVGNDPTSERLSQIGEPKKVANEVTYDLSKSIVKYRFLGGTVDQAPAEITAAHISGNTAGEIFPTSIEVLVDLVSSTFNTDVSAFKIGKNAPVDGDGAFGYLCMSDDTKCGSFKGTGSALTDDSWIDQTIYVNGIESEIANQPALAPSKVIKMPDDFKLD